jgi:hypothetical protein
MNQTRNRRVVVFFRVVTACGAVARRIAFIEG